MFVYAAAWEDDELEWGIKHIHTYKNTKQAHVYSSMQMQQPSSGLYLNLLKCFCVGADRAATHGARFSRLISHHMLTLLTCKVSPGVMQPISQQHQQESICLANKFRLDMNSWNLLTVCVFRQGECNRGNNSSLYRRRRVGYQHDKSRIVC